MHDEEPPCNDQVITFTFVDGVLDQAVEARLDAPDIVWRQDRPALACLAGPVDEGHDVLSNNPAPTSGLQDQRKDVEHAVAGRGTQPVASHLREHPLDILNPDVHYLASPERGDQVISNDLLVAPPG